MSCRGLELVVKLESWKSYQTFILALDLDIVVFFVMLTRMTM